MILKLNATYGAYLVQATNHGDEDYDIRCRRAQTMPSDTFYEDSKNLSKIKRETFLLMEIHKEISKSAL